MGKDHLYIAHKGGNQGGVVFSLPVWMPQWAALLLGLSLLVLLLCIILACRRDRHEKQETVWSPPQNYALIPDSCAPKKSISLACSDDTSGQLPVSANAATRPPSNKT